MKDLIEALQIFLKYGNPYSPTHCEHDILMVSVHNEDLDPADVARLEELGFHWNDEYDCWASFRFGSA